MLQFDLFRWRPLAAALFALAALAVAAYLATTVARVSFLILLAVFVIVGGVLRFVLRLQQT